MSTHKASDLHDFQAEMAYPRRKEDEMKIFCERVAICGLEESYKAEFVLQRAMFRVGLIVTFIFIIYEGSVITSQFEKDRIVFTDIPTGTLTPPFPKISVCFPVTVDADRIQQVLVVPKRAESLKTTFNLTNTDTIEYMKDTLSLNGHASAMGTPRHLFATRAADATVEALLQNGQDWRNLFFPTCQKVLSGCSYYGRPFDCCQVAKFITIWQLSCFQIDVRVIWTCHLDSQTRLPFQVNRADLNSVSDVVDTPQLQDTGLTFDVHTDWTHGVYQAGSASDGYHIFIDSHPTVTGDPVFIPSGMHALIVLKEPERLSELIGCRPLDSIPKLKRFDDYDPYGQQCTSEAASELLTSFIGCELPTLWYIPRDGCTFTQAFIISLAFSWDGVDDFQQTSAVFTDKFVREKYADVVSTMG